MRVRMRDSCICVRTSQALTTLSLEPMEITFLLFSLANSPQVTLSQRLANFFSLVLSKITRNKKTESNECMWWYSTKTCTFYHTHKRTNKYDTAGREGAALTLFFFFTFSWLTAPFQTCFFLSLFITNRGSKRFLFSPHGLVHTWKHIPRVRTVDLCTSFHPHTIIIKMKLSAVRKSKIFSSIQTNVTTDMASCSTADVAQQVVQRRSI